MATQYNVEDMPFTNKQDMMHYAGSMTSKVSQGMLHGVECDPNKNSGSPGKFIRGGPILESQDATNFDLGTLNVAVTSTPAEFTNKALGELWVSYTVVLRKPKFYIAEGSNIIQDYFLIKSPSTTPIPVNSTWKTYPALQNRVNGQIDLSTTNRVDYTLPATLQGSFKFLVKFIMASAGGITPGFALINLNNDGSGGTPQSLFRIKDLLSRTNAGPIEELAWDWWTVSTQPIAGTELAITTLEFDLRIESPVSVGVTTDNIISVYFTDTTKQFIGVEWRMMNYNNYFDYNGDGEPMLIDQTGKLVQVVDHTN